MKSLKNSRVHVRFSKLHEKPYYYLLIISIFQVIEYLPTKTTVTQHLHQYKQLLYRARNNGRSTINDRQEIAFDRQRTRLPIILIGKNHRLTKNTVINVVNEHRAIPRHYHRTYKQNVSYTDQPDFHLISRKS